MFLREVVYKRAVKVKVRGVQRKDTAYLAKIPYLRVKSSGGTVRIVCIFHTPDIVMFGV